MNTEVSCHNGSCKYGFTATFKLKQTELFMKHYIVKYDIKYKIVFRPKWY